MKAATHTEIYRRYEGTLRKHPFRALILADTGIRVGFRRKLPALLLFAPPAIGCIVTCVLVSLTFNAAAILPGAQRETEAIGAMLQSVLSVKLMILTFMDVMRYFALLVITWYGAGLIAEDRRLGANLLYFSRPITRFDYLLGKFLTAAFFGACALILPCFIVCTCTAFLSPEWVFVTEEWDVFLWSLAYSGLWVTTLASIVLAVSSMVERKTLALIGSIALVLVTDAISSGVSEISNAAGLRLFSLSQNFRRIGDWMFDRPTAMSWNVEASFWVVALVVSGCILILAQRVRRMEVVA